MYYTIVLAYEPHGSPWHPIESTGPFAVVSRGSFRTEEEAHAWALLQIPGYHYVVRSFDDDGEPRGDFAGHPAPAGHGLNGARVIRRGDTIFVPLPRAMWRSAGPCNCHYCKGGEAFWDTLAVAETKPSGKIAGTESLRNDTTWTVHMPEAQR